MTASPNAIYDYGYGTYNMTGNNKIKTGLIVYGEMLFKFHRLAIAAMGYQTKYGEDLLTQQDIEAGKQFWKSYGKYFK